ncbi:MAG: PstS family phosphate ABC transporter substrate-binding protein [Bdellovibrionales bacterium]|nr:PstS family phosphate ABC transporter substrate-binding protein [Bdellovibrionales bacterium]
MKASQWPFRLVLGLVFSLTIQSHASAKLQGTVKVDGSSTVFPITEAVAEEFSKIQPRVRVTVGVSGTGGGFKKFTVGETDINDASRPIKDKEVKVAKEKKVEYIQIPVAYDGISVVINPKNTWVDYLTVDELKKIWNTGSKVSTWKDIRSAWPDKKIVLYGPGTDSGTFDYFTEEINGKSQASRSDFTKSEDDNTLVQGVAGDEGAMGYFGFSYYIENKDKLKAVGIKNKGAKAAVAPTVDSINKGTYAPLSRPIFIYVSKASLNKPEVKAFVEFYIQNAAKLSKETGYVPLPAKMYEKSLAEIKSVKTRVL